MPEFLIVTRPPTLGATSTSKRKTKAPPQMCVAVVIDADSEQAAIDQTFASHLLPGAESVLALSLDAAQEFAVTHTQTVEAV